ncbi:hypothetical protein BQ8420_07250 [Nocardiopsis sp. JB363]|nr:hypothetical protein BQ8420_07250 [Nocardiopsis sp. JB363]
MIGWFERAGVADRSAQGAGAAVVFRAVGVAARIDMPILPSIR